MHQPPAVSYRVVRSRWHFFAIIGLLVLAASGALAFAVSQNGSWPSLTVCVCVATSGCLAFSGWHSAPQGRLRLDGQDWHGPKQGKVRVQLIFDFQQLLLIRTIDQEGKYGWIWLERISDSAQWRQLRRALVANRL